MITLSTSVGLAMALDIIPATIPQHTFINKVDSESKVDFIKLLYTILFMCTKIII